MYIYSNLKYIRQKLGMTKNDFGKFLGTSGANISRWENNVNGITVDMAYYIAEKLNIPIGELVGKDLKVVDKLKISEDITLDNVIMDKTKELSEDDKQKIIEIINIYSKK